MTMLGLGTYRLVMDRAVLQCLVRSAFGSWQWMTVVDDAVVHGALPFPHTVSRLIKLGVRGVVNLCDEYEGPVDMYRANEILQLCIPTPDFCAPAVQQLETAIAFIRAQASQGGKTYVHCKAGRGRSAMVVMCWLIDAWGVSTSEAQTILNTIRPQVISDLFRSPSIEKFCANRLIAQTNDGLSKLGDE